MSTKPKSHCSCNNNTELVDEFNSSSPLFAEMPEVVLCHAKPGNLATQRVPINPGKVSQLLDKAASLASAPGERLVLTYQGHILSPSASLEVPKGGLVMITVLPPPPAAPAAPAPVKMTGEEIKRFSAAPGHF